MLSLIIRNITTRSGSERKGWATMAREVTSSPTTKEMKSSMNVIMEQAGSTTSEPVAEELIALGEASIG